MSDTSPEALLAWCEQELDEARSRAKSGGRNIARIFAPRIAKLEALAALVRAQQTLRAELAERGEQK